MPLNFELENEVNLFHVHGLQVVHLIGKFHQGDRDRVCVALRVCVRVAMPQASAESRSIGAAESRSFLAPLKRPMKNNTHNR
jgi:hypothetical protein